MTARTPKIVRYTKPPEGTPLDEAQLAELATLERLADDKIDFSDIPELDDVFFDNALHGDTFRPTKRQVTLRLDAPTLNWFRRKFPKGYQTAINLALRAHILREQQDARKKAG